MEAESSLLNMRRIVLSVNSDNQGAVLKFTCLISVCKYIAPFPFGGSEYSSLLSCNWSKKGTVIVVAGKKASKRFLASSFCTFVYILVFFFFFFQSKTETL